MIVRWLLILLSARRQQFIKGVDSKVAGDCDIVIVPDIEAGNMFYKALNFLGGANSAAIIVGASAQLF